MQCRRWEVGGAAPSCTRTWKAHALPVNDVAVDTVGALLVRGARAGRLRGVSAAPRAPLGRVAAAAVP